jgi:hypothetical protein
MVMSELGYGELIPGIYGTPAPGTDPDPVSRAALQEATIQAQIRMAEQPGYVPQSYQGNPQSGPSNQQLGGPANLPKIGWTAQNGGGSPAFAPWSAEDMGHIPDWTSDANSAAGGRYDQNPVVGGSFGFDRNQRAPIGDGLLQYDDTPTNPNRPPNEVGGSVGSLEY